MTVITAHFDGKVLVPDHPVELPTGVPLRLTVDFPGAKPAARPVWQVAVDIGASVPDEDWKDVPADASRNLDHYLYDAPRESD